MIILKRNKKIKKQNPEVCIAGTTGYYNTKVVHFIYISKYF